MANKEPKELTIQQQKFLEVLFNEAAGNYKIAKEMAGYSADYPLSKITKNLKEEILDYMNQYLIANGPSALYKLVEQLEVSQPNANKLKVIDMILNRMGMGEKKEAEVKLDIPEGGIFILPAKEMQVFEKINAKESESQTED